MEPWINIVGHPVMKATERSEDTIYLRQNRFLRFNDVKPEEDMTLYHVFLAPRTKSGTESELIMTSRELEVKVPRDFPKLNANRVGFYRTSYSPFRLARLSKAAKEGFLSIEDRSGIIADPGALAESGLERKSSLLLLTKEFDQEAEMIVWREITSRLAVLHYAWLFQGQQVSIAEVATPSSYLVSSKSSHP
ncbi:Aminopeptidase 2 mitochondrial [Schaereria dolodes]|nr:Aminopeptidase 2 mitochondrial [Schaereria dolodes]